MLNCSRTLLSTFAVAFRDFLGTYSFTCTSFSISLIQTLLWRTTWWLWRHAQSLHKSVLLLVMIWRGATRCACKVEMWVVSLVPGYLSASLCNSQQCRVHKSFLQPQITILAGCNQNLLLPIHHFLTVYESYLVVKSSIFSPFSRIVKQHALFLFHCCHVEKVKSLFLPLILVV